MSSREKASWLIESLIFSNSPWKMVCVGGQVLNNAGRGEAYLEIAPKEQAYLLKRGCSSIYAGSIHPVDPFYNGLYGGAEMPGILGTDPSMLAFVEKHGFQPADSARVYHRSLQKFHIMAGHSIQIAHP